MIEVSDETTLGLFGQTDELVRILRDTLEDLARATVQLRRLAGPPPTIDWCPRCFYLRGVTEFLEFVALDDRARFLKLECPNCGFAFERQLN
jgi:hypothetical protein